MDNKSEAPPGANLPARAISTAASKQKMNYRPMTVLDIPQVHAIDKLSFSLPWPERSYNYELTQNANSILWVAEVLPDQSHLEPSIIGMIVIWLVVDEAHLATIAIHPDYRGQKLSTILLALGLRSAILRGAIDSTLEVRAGNLVAQKLYEKFGYQVVGVRPRYYRDNYEDAVLMTVTGLGAEYLKWLESIIASG